MGENLVKEKLADSTPKDPHVWEKFTANLVGANDHGVIGQSNYWVCTRCHKLTLSPPEWAHNWPKCKEVE